MRQEALEKLKNIKHNTNRLNLFVNELFDKFEAQKKTIHEEWRAHYKSECIKLEESLREDFDSRLCKNCQYEEFTRKINVCINTKSPMYHEGTEPGFGCNQFKRRKP